MRQHRTAPKVLAVAWGEPLAPTTYSGVAAGLFSELAQRGRLAGGLDARQSRPVDLFRGAIDWRRSLADRRPRRNSVWRYLPETIDLLSGRLQAAQRRSDPHDVVVQFGVAGIPSKSTPLVAHVEISVETAMSATLFAGAYGFSRVPDRVARRAIDGERRFLDACSIVWTNSEWTAAGLQEQGVGDDRLRICAPGAGFDDPGEIERNWMTPHVLFVGKQWSSKGGDLLIDGFRRFRADRPDAHLTIVGCQPAIHEQGVDVLGFLDRSEPQQAAALAEAFRAATIFCMPSYWESTGVVYLEAALYGLPIIMLTGQGRETTFPSSMAVHLSEPRPELLASALTELAADPDRMLAMGANGRRHVLERHTWSFVADRVSEFVAQACADEHVDPRALP